MVTGIGAFIDPDKLTVPEIQDMGVMMKKGKLTKIMRPRINGEPTHWQTSSERAMRYHHDPQTVWSL